MRRKGNWASFGFFHLNVYSGPFLQFTTCYILRVDAVKGPFVSPKLGSRQIQPQGKAGLAEETKAFWQKIPPAKGLWKSGEPVPL